MTYEAASHQQIVVLPLQVSPCRRQGERSRGFDGSPLHHQGEYPKKSTFSRLPQDCCYIPTANNKVSRPCIHFRNFQYIEINVIS